MEGTKVMDIPDYKFKPLYVFPLASANGYCKALFLFISLAFFAANSASAAELKVCKTCDFKTVSSAVKAAKPYDKILVQQGYYAENNIEIKKPLQLIGVGKPVIDAQNKKGIFQVETRNVTIKGFELRNVEVSYLRDFAAIKVYEGAHVTITDNHIKNAFFGIYLQRTDSCTVARNLIEGEARTETTSGNAIHLWYSDFIQISDNKTSGHRDGIYLEFAKRCTIKDNLSFKNIRYGLHFMFSDGNTYTHNTFKNNGAGVAVMYTRDIVMQHNTFEHNWGPAAYGLLLKDISRSTISNNRFIKNTAGIYMEGSSYLHIEKNTFQGNGWALRVLSSCSEDTFRLNNFMSNTFDVSTNASSTSNFFGHNYWDKYEGYDLNKDKIGDVPYRPVSLYSLVVERVPSSIMFLRSFIVDLMDRMEKVIPSFTPEMLKDDSPVLRKYAYDHV
ncbi:nitrous oxide reductase family maturation protein NosD [Adhaeribacter terreus]|uniref:Nitrous oxide reductase family maturation protein NosD n=1 Tax=Adhaeribacter terreus TaxID=529703 RepID=A0ABW0E690_9BACT